MDTETERRKYVKMYSHDEYKAHPHSVFYAERLLELTDWKPGDTVLDLGCGPGYASMHFVEKGLSVQAVDIAPNCLKTEHEGKFPLLISSLWELPATVRVKWGLCADVMEHLPPDYVDDTLRTIALAVEDQCFFNICFRPDGLGRLIGETLHLTVKSREWWEAKLGSYWREVTYIDGKPNDHGNFIVGQPRRN